MQIQTNITISALFDLTHTLAAPLLSRFTYPWEVLAHISTFLQELGATLSPDEYDQPRPGVWIHRTAAVAPGASIAAPCIICAHAEIRHCAFIRGNALVGKNAVVGNSTELKNVILFDNVEVPHYNYVGDSILGYKAHMGAGSITSNIKSDRQPVVIHGPDGAIPTSMIKIGAMLGDHAEIGCGSVLNPGAIIGRNSSVYPLTSVRGHIPANCICKDANTIVPRK